VQVIDNKGNEYIDAGLSFECHDSKIKSAEDLFKSIPAIRGEVSTYFAIANAELKQQT
jgi:hypothetical protein